MRVAIIHDWLYNFAGAERVLEQILQLYPHADVFCLFDLLSSQDRNRLTTRNINTSFLQHLPYLAKYYRHTLPIMPIAIEQFDLSAYELIISSSHAVAKGIITGPNQLHISYMHSPIRYAWDLQNQYLQQASLMARLISPLTRYLLHKIRVWDVVSANRVDHFIANSAFIARRIGKVYKREAKVIYPPVDTGLFTLQTDKENFYIVASRMVPYKRIELIVEAFNLMPDLQLIVIGDGPALPNIRAIAGSNTQFLGYQPPDVLRDYLQRAKAMVFAGIEDFGILPVEAQACGTPVIAYAQGGLAESIRGLGHDKPTGVFFSEQSASKIQQAVRLFEQRQQEISPVECRKNAERFSISQFQQTFSSFIEQAWEDFAQRTPL